MRECKDFCRQLDRISFGFGGKIYTDKIKFCSTCCKHMKIDGYRCKCCGSQVRCKSHARRWKKSQHIGGIGI